MAAALHDFYKKDEIMLMKAEGLSWDSYNKAGAQSDHIIREAGFSNRVANLASSVGHTTVLEAESIALKPQLTDDEKAYLAMHYCDDYTVDARGVQPAAFDETTDRWENDLTRRMQKNIANPRYAVLNEAGVQYFGEPSYVAQERVGVIVEERLAGLIGERLGQQIDPILLPEFIDNQLHDDIMSYSR